MDGRVRVKICGVTTVADALAAAAAGADAIGLNFHPGSPRCVSPATAAAIVAVLPPQVCPVGVFVDRPRDEIGRIAAAAGLRALQFHGDEAPADCRGWPYRTIKAIRVRDASAARLARGYDVDFILADAWVPGRPGGTGQPIPLDWLADFERRRLILAGGLTPDTVRDAVRAVRPFGVDVASGVESAPGRKDPEKMRRFVDHAHAA